MSISFADVCDFLKTPHGECEDERASSSSSAYTIIVYVGELVMGRARGRGRDLEPDREPSPRRRTNTTQRPQLAAFTRCTSPRRHLCIQVHFCRDRESVYTPRLCGCCAYCFSSYARCIAVCARARERVPQVCDTYRNTAKSPLVNTS